MSFLFELGFFVVVVGFLVFVFAASTVTAAEFLEIALLFVEISTLLILNVPLPVAFVLKVRVTLPKSASSEKLL